MRTRALGLAAALGTCWLWGAVEALGAARSWPAWRARVPAAELRSVDLGDAVWARNGVAEEVARETDDAGRCVVLEVTESGERWSTMFLTAAAGSWRLDLVWDPGPDGALFEIVIDGRRLTPARDGWRPTRRRVTTDLGTVWLGGGRHLIEFVLREEVDEAVLRLRRLGLEPLAD